MKKTYFAFCILTSVSSLISCKENIFNKNDKKAFKEVEKLNWLIGKWEYKDENGVLIEFWKKKNDSTLAGKSFYIKGKDTLHYETIELVQSEDRLLYIPTVKGQNNNQPVTFKLTENDEKDFVFENPKHDYPQKIKYTKKGNSLLVATISGIQNDKNSSESYFMKKIK